MTKTFWLNLSIVVIMAVTGCTHTQLRYNTVRQAQTVADVHTKQVLDNVAKFATDPHALPHFSYPNQGAAAVADSGSGSTSFSFTPHRLAGWGFGLGGSRTNNESYVMTPINDPERLTLMRCCYQKAVTGCTGCFAESCDCPNCSKRLSKFYTGSENVKQTGEVTPDGKSVYLVKTDVLIIYFPPSAGGSYYETISNGPAYEHFVTLEKDELGNDIYRYLRTNIKSSETQGSDSRFDFPPVGTALYKLGQSDISAECDLMAMLDAFNKSPELAQQVRFVFQDSQYLLADIVPVLEFAGLLPRSAGLPERLMASPLYGKTFMSSGGQLSLTDATDLPEAGSFASKDMFEEKLSEVLQSSSRKDEKDLDTESCLLRTDDQIALADPADRPIVLIPQAFNAKEDLDRPQVANSLAEQTRRSGRVTPACVTSDCWYCVGTRKEVPRGIPASYVGNFGSTYVWVPKHGRDQLAKLTLCILDLATSDAATSPTTEVYAFVGADGKTATGMTDAAYVAKATLGRGSSFGGLLPTSSTNAKPPSLGEISALEKARDSLRDAFVFELESRGMNVFGSVAQLSETADEVTYLGFDFKQNSVEVGDDALIRLAAAVLNSKDRMPSVLVAESDEKATDAVTTKVIRKAARNFLSAELRLQQLNGVAASTEGGIVTGPSSPSTTFKSNILQFNQAAEAVAF